MQELTVESHKTYHSFNFQPGDGTHYRIILFPGHIGLDKKGNQITYIVVPVRIMTAMPSYIMEKMECCRHTAIVLGWFYHTYLRSDDAQLNKIEFTKKNHDSLSSLLTDEGCEPLSPWKDK